MIWFTIFLIILAIGSLLWGIHSSWEEAERLIEEEKRNESIKEQHDTRTGGETD